MATITLPSVTHKFSELASTISAWEHNSIIFDIALINACFIRSGVTFRKSPSILRKYRKTANIYSESVLPTMPMCNERF